MPTAAAQTQDVGVAPAPGGTVPFFYGGNQYVERFFSASQLLDTAQHEQQVNIKPGGFLRGVRLEIRGTGGVLGTGVVSPDGPWSCLASVVVENIDGGSLLYPMSAYAHVKRNQYSRPWFGDPSRRFDFSNSINPSGSLFMQTEVRHTLGVLENTDARAQYSLRFTFATSAQFLTTVGTATLPTVVVTCYLETWAQPDKEDLADRPIEALPPGLGVSTLARHQVVSLNAAGADNTLQASNMGNENRLYLMITRDSNGVRQDLLGTVIRWRLDERSLGVFSPDELFNQMADFYPFLSNGTVRDTGLYAFSRFFDPGRMLGQAWMTTTNATYQIWEFQTATGGTNGTIELITDEIVPKSGFGLPMELESI